MLLWIVDKSINKNKNKLIPRSMRTSVYQIQSRADAYAKSRHDPFSPDALGCRIPDEYSLPSEAAHLRSNLTVTSTSVGTAVLTILPNVSVPILLNNGTVSGATFDTNTVSGHLVSNASLTSRYSSVRVVAVGVRISNRQPPGSAIGVVTVAQTPCLSTMPSTTVLAGLDNTTGNAQAILLAATGLTNVSGVIPGLENLPDADIFPIQELMGQDILAVPKINSSQFTHFRAERTLVSSFTAGGVTVYDYGDDVVATATNTVSTLSGTKSMTDCTGWNAIVISASGLPASTVSFNVEIIMHIEGTPIVTSTPSFISSSVSNSPVQVGAVERSIAQSSRTPPALLMSAERVHQSSSYMQRAGNIATKVVRYAIPRLMPVAGKVAAAAAQRYGGPIANAAIRKFDRLVANKLGLPLPSAKQLRIGR